MYLTRLAVLFIHGEFQSHHQSPQMDSISLAASDLSMRFGKQKLFEDLNFSLQGGIRVGIAGNNGSGKSTLLKLLAGMFPPTKGEISLHINGQAIPEQHRKFEMGWVAPYLNLYNELSLIENLQFLAQLRGKVYAEAELKALLQRGGMWEKRHQRLSGYSSGMRQRALIFSAVAHQPPIYLFDEPASNLDEAGKTFVEQLVQDACKAGKLVIWASNEPTELARCDSVLTIQTPSLG